MQTNYENYSDIELYNLLKKDKKIAERAFAEIYNRHSARIYAYCRRFLGNKEDAQDVFQETFIRFIETTTQDRMMTNIPAFILKIARNLCVNVKRKEKSPITYEDYMASDSTSIENDELLSLIKTAIDILPPEYKDMFILREYDGLTYTEIAEMTNTQISTVKIRIFRAKQKIRDILSPYLNDITKNF